MKQYKINEEVLNAILVYLMTRPYQDVANGIKMLQSLEEIKEDKTNHCK
jgi:hypothetical protein